VYDQWVDVLDDVSGRMWRVETMMMIMRRITRHWSFPDRLKVCNFDILIL